jgi:MinD-like ATPase involved in chromosome partitioning or flagellar assembly
VTTPARGGRIITFYSYKGGTGRSMALANVAWILASHGLRVLAIDWDLEAPGLHRYFHPFLEDKELENSPGLIDYVVEFTEAARHAVRNSSNTPTPDKWYDRFTSLLRYTYSLEWGFGDGTLDFVPAGQQGRGYSLRVNGFDWQEFYEKLGGGVLFEGVKRRLREDYDYVLIDSRTGISDTSGICTIQMPDDLVVCFTLNQQSIKGAAAVAESANIQRRRTTGEPSLRIWPVPTRIEPAEKDRLDAARETARATFQQYLGHLPRKDREAYWNGIEILYQPYFAYEEELAVFAEKRRQRASMLSSLEALAERLTDGTVVRLAEMGEQERLKGLDLFRRAPSLGRGVVFVSFPYDDLKDIEPVVTELADHLGDDAIWWDRSGLSPGDDWPKVIEEALLKAKVVLAFFGPGWATRVAPRYFESQVVQVLKRSIPVIPVLVGDLRVSEWATAAEKLEVGAITKRQAFQWTQSLETHSDVAPLWTRVRQVLDRDSQSTLENPDDPQKGKWGGKAVVDGRSLTAEVRSITDDWFGVTLVVAGTKDKSLEGTVDFHLHPTFSPPIVTVDVAEGRATLGLSSWGAFTVGAAADGGKTRLELDLSENRSFPEKFRSR